MEIGVDVEGGGGLNLETKATISLDNVDWKSSDHLRTLRLEEA